MQITNYRLVSETVLAWLALVGPLMQELQGAGFAGLDLPHQPGIGPVQSPELMAV